MIGPGIGYRVSGIGYRAKRSASLRALRADPRCVAYSPEMQMFRVVLAMLAALVCGGCGSEPMPSTLPQATITIISADGDAPVHIDVEVATTSVQRQQGLMFRQSMDENRGMLFLFRTDSAGGF